MNSTALSLDWEKICKALRLPFTKRSTGVIVTPCPFHYEKTPSLHMWPKSGNFRCHGCGKDGNQRQFLARILGVPEDSPEIKNQDFYGLCDTEGQKMLNLGIYWEDKRKPLL